MNQNQFNFWQCFDVELLGKQLNVQILVKIQKVSNLASILHSTFPHPPPSLAHATQNIYNSHSGVSFSWVMRDQFVLFLSFLFLLFFPYNFLSSSSFFLRKKIQSRIHIKYEVAMLKVDWIGLRMLQFLLVCHAQSIDCD